MGLGQNVFGPTVPTLVVLVFMPAFFGGQRIEGAQHLDDLPTRIVAQEGLPPEDGEGAVAYARRPALRGCCGEPAEFRWVLPDSRIETTAGAPFRTRVMAFDAQGRQARPSSCGALRVDLGLTGGHARLSPATSPPRWRGAELHLDIESEVAGLVEAEVRIASPKPDADVLLHTYQIRFASGPAHELTMDVRRSSAGADVDKGRASDAAADDEDAISTWPVGTTLEVVVSLRDRFGNRVPLPASPRATSFFGCCAGGLALRSSSAGLLEATPDDWRFRVDRLGSAHSSIRGTASGTAEIWLEPAHGNSTTRQRRELRQLTARTVRFAELARGNSTGLSVADARWQAVALEVKDAFMHAWRGYKRHAWGRDELQPLSKQGRDSFGGIGMTILDSLTTLLLMGLDREFDEALKFVREDLRFGVADMEVSVFELVIRALGGLLGAHTLTGHKVLLERAADLGARLLPALNTTSKLPWPKWNLAKGSGGSAGEPTILAEAGSLQLEYEYLAAQTGDARFRDLPGATFDAIQSAGFVGLVPVYLTPHEFTPVRPLASKFALGALADSYYEYLLKQWLQRPEEERFKRLWLKTVDEIPSLVVPSLDNEKGTAKAPSLKLLEMKPSGATIWKMDHLSCFTPAMLVLGLQTLPRRDLVQNGRNTTLLRLAEGITASCAEMWTSSKSGLAPEFSHVTPRPPYHFLGVPDAGQHSFLRPETVESLFHLHRFTGNEKYRRWGEQIFRAILAHAKVEDGFASVRDITSTPTEKLDEMQSFVMAETFKYLYLLFSPSDALDLERYVLNTEGHPLPRGRL